jgi:transcriptional regulator with XRE-family HTH domain
VTVHRDIRFASVLRRLLDARFKNNRKEFAQAIHISESALSQYVRGKATPGLAMLVSIARELDVSLDYLVFGDEPDAPTPDYGELVAHLEHAISRSRAQSAGIRDFVGRVGAALAEQIEATAINVLKDSFPSTGLTTTEMLRLEGHSRLTRIATADLDSDIILLDQGPSAESDDVQPTRDSQVAPAPFTPVVTSNIKRGRDYYYAIPEGAGWRHKARRLRDAVATVGGVSTATVDRHIRFHESGRALVPGFVMYALDTKVISARSDSLLDQIADFVDAESGLVVLATSYQTQIYAPIEPKYHGRLVRDYEEIIKTSPRLTFD